MKTAIKTRQQSNVARTKATSSSFASSSAASTSGESDAYNLVGFGPHKLMSRFDLYHSTQDEHQRYVQSILECNVNLPGGQLDKLKRYFQRMKREQVDDELLSRTTYLAEQALQRTPPLPLTVPAPAAPLKEPRALEKVSCFINKSIVDESMPQLGTKALMVQWQALLPTIQAEDLGSIPSRCYFNSKLYL